MFKLRVSKTLSSFLMASCDRGPGMLVCITGLEGSFWKTEAFARNAELAKLRENCRELHRRARAGMDEGV